jgi:class 3 adenylate cyclase
VLYRSLEEFLVSKELTIDAEMDDGWGARFPLKGREIEATILFADITSFSKNTECLSSTETMLYINKFIAWISAEGLVNTCGIIDKYIGDEILIVFSNEFGSQNHFLDALEAARRFGEWDEWQFMPHMGLASGIVTVGYTGTPLCYNCTVFGRPVTIAARCSTVKIEEEHSAQIVFPVQLFDNYSFEQVFYTRVVRDKNGLEHKLPMDWRMLPCRRVSQKEDDFEVLPIIKSKFIQFLFDIDSEGSISGPTDTIQTVKEEIQSLIDEGQYKPLGKK